MKPDAQHVRRWRKHVRALVKADPRLRRLRKTKGGVGRRALNIAAVRWIVPVLLAVVATGAGTTTLLQQIMVLWTWGVIFSRAHQIGNALHNPATLWLPFALPLADDAVFAYQRRLILRSAGWLALDWVGMGVGGLIDAPSWTLALAVPVVAVTQALGALALAAWLVWWKPSAPFGAGAGLCWCLLWVSMILEKQGWYFAKIFSPLMQAVSLLTPAGWISAFGSAAAAGSVLAWVGLLVTAAGALGVAGAALRALRRRFDLDAVFGFDPAGAQGEEDSSAAAEALRVPADAAPAAEPSDEAAVRAAWARAREETPAEALAARGTLERWLVRRLSVRAQALIAVLQPQSVLGWTRGWLMAFGVVVGLRLLQFAGLPAGWAAGLSAIAVTLWALPLFGGQWSGFGGSVVFMKRVGFQSLWPVGFGESARLMLGVGMLRMVVAWPLVLLVCRTGFEAEPLPWLEALDCSVRVVLLVLALQPVWVIAAFSKTTNDTSVHWWFTLLLLGAILYGVVVLLAAAAAGLLGETAVALPALAGALVNSLLLLAAYGWCWSRSLVDAVAFEKPPGSW